MVRRRQKVKLPTSAVQDVQQAAQQKTQSTNPMDLLAGFMGSFMTTLMDPIRIGLEESVRRVVVKVKWNEPGGRAVLRGRQLHD